MKRSARPRLAPNTDKNSLLFRVRQGLRRIADPSKALAMQAYMKSAMQYHGVPVPIMRKACKELFAEVSFSSRADWRTKVLELWRGSQFREERYAAIVLTGVKRAAAFQ